MIQPMTLTQEFSLANQYYPDILCEANAGQRRCIATIQYDSLVASIAISFPSHYPNNAPPSFEFTAQSNLSVLQRTTLKGTLVSLVTEYVSKNQMCLIPCLESLIAKMRELASSEKGSSPSMNPIASPHLQAEGQADVSSNTSPGYNDESCGLPCSTSVGTNIGHHKRLSLVSVASCNELKPVTRQVYVRFATYEKDSNVPFPRTSGAVFGGNDKLVVFNCVRSDHCRVGTILTRPASINRLYDYASHIGNEQTRGHAVFGAAGTGTLAKTEEKNIYTPLDDEPLDDIYCLRSYFTATTNQHALVGSAQKKNKKKQATKMAIDLAVQIMDVTPYLPINKTLAVTYKLSGGDIPSICFRNAKAAEDVGRSDLAEAWELAGLSSNRQLCSSSANHTIGDIPWANHPFGESLMNKIMLHFESVKDIQTLAMLACVFSQAFTAAPLDTTAPTPQTAWAGWHKYLGCFMQYSEILYRWQMHIPRTELLLYRPGTNPRDQAIWMAEVCKSCHSVLLADKMCRNCNVSWSFECGICRLAVRGLTAICMVCEHGGHTQHIQAWFDSYKTCPTGCGCICTDYAITNFKKRATTLPCKMPGP